MPTLHLSYFIEISLVSSAIILNFLLYIIHVQYAINWFDSTFIHPCLWNKKFRKHSLLPSSVLKHLKQHTLPCFPPFNYISSSDSPNEIHKWIPFYHIISKKLKPTLGMIAYQGSQSRLWSLWSKPIKNARCAHCICPPKLISVLYPLFCSYFCTNYLNGKE